MKIENGKEIHRILVGNTGCGILAASALRSLSKKNGVSSAEGTRI
jgi:hypothetical protein